MNTHTILFCLVKSLNCVVYEHILIEKITEEVKRKLTAVNVDRVFTQSLMLILSCFIEVARTLLLNIHTNISILAIANLIDRSLQLCIKRLISFLCFFFFIYQTTILSRSHLVN